MEEREEVNYQVPLFCAELSFLSFPIFITFLILKLTSVISWDWVFIFLPIIITYGLVFFYILICTILIFKEFKRFND